MTTETADVFSPLPDVLVGPLLRRVTHNRLVLWLVGSRPLDLQLTLWPEGQGPYELSLDKSRCRCLAVGRHAHVHLIDVTLDEPLPCDVRIEYDLSFTRSDGERQGIADWAAHLCHDGASLPGFVIASRLGSVLHGSCRKPHHSGGDALVRADAWLNERWSKPESRPAWLLMTGDQIYADDVAGPMLTAIHALIERLGLFDETLEGAKVADSQALYAAMNCYYGREGLLPDVKSSRDLQDRFFGGVQKPIFTTDNAHNHLITFAEVMAMYLLVWSPVPWRLIAPERPPLSAEHEADYEQERAVITDFVEGLPGVARLLANQQTLMIFDDHDVTDDWNLTADWEETAYGHAFSRRIIGNALMAYAVCQGWGNDPDRLREPIDALDALMERRDDEAGWLPADVQDETIGQLLRFEGWEYVVETSPKLVVLDTRTRRWRSESRRHRPSGLMDWEALSELQQHLLDESSVIIVSPAPMFGVKLIEGVQRLFTLIGKPLLVDAENWMAHRGAASVMLNIFRHSRTPANYVILSGDVHYSFVYDIHIRHRSRGPQLWQITSSGLKNTFPDTLLDWFDRLNRWLYAPRSPLNWFTKRRIMRIRPRIPDCARAGERLWNGTGIGYVCFDEQGRPIEILQLDTSGRSIRFQER